MEELLNCSQVAARYGVKLDTVRKWVRVKLLPAIKIGKEYRFRPSDLKDFEDKIRTV